MSDYQLKTLKNGLRLILVPKKSTEVVTVMAMFRVGSRNEEPEIAGISHLLEHMHYKGTKKRPKATEIAEFIESIGGEHNAFTNKEFTGYYTKLAPKYIEKAFDFLSDNLINSTFDKAELEKEKSVIVEEINMYEDLPMIIVENRFEEAVFGNNALGQDIIGTKESVRNTTAEKLFEYKNKYYSAENAVLVLAGNFGKYSEDDLAALAEKYFAINKTKSNPMSGLKLNDKKAVRIIEKKTEQSHIVVGFKTVSFEDPDFFPLEILATILGGGMSSRMFSEIREKRGLAYSVKTACSNYIESGVLYTQAGVPNEKVEEAVSAIMEEYKKIKKNVPSEAEISKAKEMICGRMLIKFEDSEELADHYAIEATLSKKILTPKELLERYQSVTQSDILRIAKKYFTDDRLGFTYIGPKIDKEKIKKLLQI